MKTLIGTVLLAGAVIGLYFLNDITRTDDGRSVLDVAGDPEIFVNIAQPKQRDILRIVQAPGEVEPVLEVDISAEVVGKILEMAVEEGDSVEAGQLLCRLDDADYKARLTSAQANVAKLEAAIIQAQADLDKAKRDTDRQIRLSEADATSAIELADYHTSLVGAESRLKMRDQELIEAQAMVESAKEDLEKTVITAPITGIVAQRFAKAGEVVITGTMNNPGTRIMVVSDMSKMQVRCRVDESDAPLVKAEQAARVYLQSDVMRSVPGSVLRVASKGTKATGRDVVTFETLIIVESPEGKVKPGMTASVEIEVARSDQAVTIPIQAVVTRKRKDLPTALVTQFDELQSRLAASTRIRAAEYIPVIFVSDELTARPRVVEAGINDELGVEIKNGLKVDETVVVGPYRSLDQLKDGSKLKLTEDKKEEAKKAADASVEVTVD